MNINIPEHIAIIMDGNGRWATKRGLSRSKGHLEGSKALQNIVKYSAKIGIKVLSVFAFSTENFKRSSEEVSYLMNLFVKTFNKQFKDLNEMNIRVIFSGRKEGLPEKVVRAMDQIVEETKNCTGLIFNICINYGGQSEIIDAVKKLVNENINIATLDEGKFKKYLYNNLLDIDLVIRTSGEQRISNFMLYQLAYAELYFTDTYWPDFCPEDLDKAIAEYNNRHRRFGKA